MSTRLNNGLYQAYELLKEGKPALAKPLLEDALAEAQEAEMVAIAIQNTEELDNFADCQFMITKPLCIVCDDAGLLEEALRLYQGRALYEGSLSEEDLLPMCRKYGLII